MPGSPPSEYPLPDAWTALLARQKNKQRLEDKRTRQAAQGADESTFLQSLSPKTAGTADTSQKPRRIPPNYGKTGGRYDMSKNSAVRRPWMADGGEPAPLPRQVKGNDGKWHRRNRVDADGNMLPRARPSGRIGVQVKGNDGKWHRRGRVDADGNVLPPAKPWARIRAAQLAAAKDAESSSLPHRP